MKTIKLLMCIILCTTIGSHLQSQSKLTNITPVTGKGEFSTPVWSPDGNKLLFTDHNYDALYIVDLNTSNNKIEKIKTAQGIGYLADWSADSKSIIFREKPMAGTFSDVRVKSIDLTTKKEKIVKNLHPDNTKMISKAKSSENLIVYINQETLKLEAKEGINGKPWIITKEEGEFYHPIVSPDQKSVVVHAGANIYMYSVYGKQKVKNLGIGLASSWLPDSSGVVTFEDKSDDGHHVSASELFYISIESSKKIQLTSTKDAIEMWGDVSSDGKKIAYSDEKSGKIFIADLNLNN